MPLVKRLWEHHDIGQLNAPCSTLLWSAINISRAVSPCCGLARCWRPVSQPVSQSDIIINVFLPQPELGQSWPELLQPSIANILSLSSSSSPDTETGPVTVSLSAGPVQPRVSKYQSESTSRHSWYQLALLTSVVVLQGNDLLDIDNKEDSL